jgi:hypothetical protein
METPVGDQQIKLTTLMMKAVCTSKRPVNFYQTTWGNIPEDSHLHSQ